MCVTCGKFKTNKVVKTSTCKGMYNELVILDLKAISKFSETKDSNFLNINKQLRAWIQRLNTECPPEEDLQLIKEILNSDEYTID